MAVSFKRFEKLILKKMGFFNPSVFTSGYPETTGQVWPVEIFFHLFSKVFHAFLCYSRKTTGP